MHFEKLELFENAASGVLESRGIPRHTCMCCPRSEAEAVIFPVGLSSPSLLDARIPLCTMKPGGIIRTVVNHLS